MQKHPGFSWVLLYVGEGLEEVVDILRYEKYHTT
jgi:hypothetical protein